MDIINVALAGIVAVLLAVQFKNNKQEYGVYIGIAACVIIFVYAATKLETIVNTINTIQSYIDIDAKYISTLVKIIGITYVAEFSSNICKDAGYSAIGSQIEIFGKLSVLAVSMPIILALLETINSFLA